MRKKKDEPREIPIEYVDESKGQEMQEEDGQPPPDEPQEDFIDSAAAEGDAADPEEADQPAETVESVRKQMQAQIDALNQDKSLLYDQVLRRQAEFENFRRRSDRERTEAYQRARGDVLMELLPVIDNYERALSSLEKSGDDAEALRQGIELIHKQFNEALTKLGLQPVDAVGKAFDPHVHEAVTLEPSSEHEENTIIEEFQRGYKLGDRLLRPAKVKVASSPDS